MSYLSCLFASLSHHFCKLVIVVKDVRVFVGFFWGGGAGAGGAERRSSTWMPVGDSLANPPRYSSADLP
jgi:hypothetical protein